jgi:hydrogenase maturation protein HypF
VQRGEPVARVSQRFHNMLVGGIVHVARQAGLERVVLAGGCFQNVRLLERAVDRLEAGGFKPYWPRQVPINDGGLAVGQAAIAAWRSR